jgi:DUF1009 family protein
MSDAAPAVSSPSFKRIGLIAGNGRFPFIFSENAKRLGYTIIAVALIGETDTALESYVDRIHWIRVGQLNRLIQAFKKDDVCQAVMLGGIKKTHLFSGIRPDLRGLALLTRLKSRKDDEILRSIASELEKDGIEICDSTFGLEDILVEEGTLTTRSPNKREQEDIQYGWEIAKAIGQLDIGQCVVIRDKVVVAVEAVEGTDEAILRGGVLAKEGAVIVKRSKPQQDLRFDLPTIGPRTIEMMESNKSSVLALEAGKTILLDRQEFLARANQANIAVVGLTN